MQIFVKTTLADNDFFYMKFKDAVFGSGSVSKIYRLLCCMLCKGTVSIKAQREKDLGLHFTISQWEAISSRSNYVSNVSGIKSFKSRFCLDLTLPHTDSRK